MLAGARIQQLSSRAAGVNLWGRAAESQISIFRSKDRPHLSVCGV